LTDQERAHHYKDVLFPKDVELSSLKSGSRQNEPSKNSLRHRWMAAILWFGKTKNLRPATRMERTNQSALGPLIGRARIATICSLLGTRNVDLAARPSLGCTAGAAEVAVVVAVEVEADLPGASPCRHRNRMILDQVIGIAQSVETTNLLAT